MRDKKVGYFARCGDEALCFGDDACIIAGSQSDLNRYIRAYYSPEMMVHKRKTWLSEVLHGLEMGGIYAFDPKGYQNFDKLVRQCGYDINVMQEASTSQKNGFPFIVVSPV